jgi:hypothetical protein
MTVRWYTSCWIIHICCALRIEWRICCWLERGGLILWPRTLPYFIPFNFLFRGYVKNVVPGNTGLVEITDMRSCWPHNSRDDEPWLGWKRIWAEGLPPMRKCWSGNVLDWYSGGARFWFRPNTCYHDWGSRFSSVPPGKSGIPPRPGQCHFLADPFRFILRHSSYRLTLCSLRYWQRREVNDILMCVIIRKM